MYGSLRLEPGQPFRTSALPSSRMVLTSVALAAGDQASLYVRQQGNSILIAKLRRGHDEFQSL
jgi:hypothetical protein